MASRKCLHLSPLKILGEDLFFEHSDVLPDVLEQGHDEVKGAVLPLGAPETLLPPEPPRSPLPCRPRVSHWPPLTFTKLASTAAIAGPGCQDEAVKILSLNDVSRLSLRHLTSSSSRRSREASGSGRSRRARRPLRSWNSTYVIWYIDFTFI